MADTLIKDLTTKAIVVATDQLPINDAAGGNVDKKILLSAVKTYTSDSTTLVTPASLGVQQQDFDLNGNNLDKCGVAYLIEQAAADADIAGSGQHWVKTATPNVPMFTDDAGTDFELASKTGTQAPKQAFILACSDLTTALSTGTSVAYFRVPFAFTVTEVRAAVLTAGTTSVITVDINEGGTSILSTKITIDATETSSETAATAPVISDSVLADDGIITVDIDGVDSGATGAGLSVEIIGYQT